MSVQVYPEDTNMDVKHGTKGIFMDKRDSRGISAQLTLTAIAINQTGEGPLVFCAILQSLKPLHAHLGD